jgi:hypothetical protein
MMLWTNLDRTRFFLIPDDQKLQIGELAIVPLSVGQRFVSSVSVEPFEVTEAEALRWAREELGDSVTELKQVIEAKLDDWRRQLDDFKNTPLTRKTKVTPEAGAVFYELLAALPKVFRESTSEDETRVEQARETMADFERRFTESGLNVHGRVKAFPDRLAKAGRKSSPSGQNSPVPPPRNR